MITMSEEFETIEVVPGNELLSLPSFLVQSEFAFLIGLLRKATQKEINPIRIQMKDLPSNEIFAAYASCEIEKSHTNAITFAIQDLKQPFSSYNDAMWSYFEPEMKRRIAELEVDDSISARVKNSLVELLPQGNGIIEDIAEKLNMTKRTLQRKLSEENTTFQKQLNRTREILAIHYLRNTDMTTNDMAYLLGYAELNSFLRAFTSWTGKTITEYRKNLNDR